MKIKEIPKILNDFLDYLLIQNYSKDTIIKYKDDLIDFFIFIKFYKKIHIPIINFSETILLNIKNSDIISYLIFLNNIKNNCATTRYRKSFAIKCFYKWLIKFHPTNDNPAIDLMQLVKTVKLPKYLTLKEAKKIQTIFNSNNSKNSLRNNTIIMLFLSTGIRISELVNINLRDISFKENTIIITRGKGNKSRTVYFSNLCKKQLLDYIHSKKEIELSSALFTKANNERLCISSVRAICKKAYKLMGLEDYKYTPHTLRHTSATIMYKYNKKNILLVKEFLGHESIISTEIYTHTDNEMVREAVERNPLSNFIPKEQKVA